MPTLILPLISSVLYSFCGTSSFVCMLACKGVYELLHILSGKQRGDVLVLGTSFKQLTLTLKALKDQAVAKIAPELKGLVEKFFKWMTDNKEKIIGTISSIAKWFADFAVAVSRAAGLMGGFIERITGTENGLKMLAIGGTLLMLSFRPMLAMLAGLVLILDDIAGWKQGKDSLFAGLYEALSKIPNLEKILGGAALLIFLGKLSGVLGGIGVALTPLVKLSKFLPAIAALAAINMASDKLGEGIQGEGVRDKMRRVALDEEKTEFILQETKAKAKETVEAINQLNQKIHNSIVLFLSILTATLGYFVVNFSNLSLYTAIPTLTFLGGITVSTILLVFGYSPKDARFSNYDGEQLLSGEDAQYGGTMATFKQQYILGLIEYNIKPNMEVMSKRAKCLRAALKSAILTFACSSMLFLGGWFVIRICHNVINLVYLI